jgi:hypothetical protein
MGLWTAFVAVASTLSSVTAPGAPTAPAVSLSASFVLKTIDAQGTDTVSGAVSFIPGGEVCVAVKTPVVQEMHLTPRELVIYYPGSSTRGARFRANRSCSSANERTGTW